MASSLVTALRRCDSTSALSSKSDEYKTLFDADLDVLEWNTPASSTDNDVVFHVNETHKAPDIVCDVPTFSPENAAGFFSLPPEIRIKIYELVVGTPRINTYLDVDITSYLLRIPRTEQKDEKIQCGALLSVCKTFYLEAMPVWFSRATFVVGTSPYGPVCYSLHQFSPYEYMPTIFPVTLRQLKNVTLHLHLDYFPYEDIVEQQNMEMLFSFLSVVMTPRFRLITREC